jgi:hypothetical protein
MIARIATHLDASADHVWAALKQPWSFVYVTRGVLGLKTRQPLPPQWPLGETVQARLIFFHLIPAWTHELQIVHIDDSQREVLSNERGGLIKLWNHRITVTPVSSSCCRYVDEIDIEAGALTPLVWLLAHLFYRYRQMRWRYLARQLIGKPIDTRP